ncbi:MAG: response regulator [Propionibacteriaceae bacterium]
MLIIVPVIRLDLVRTKKLATGLAALLFAIAVGRGLVASHYLFPGVDRRAGAVTFWWEAVWNVITAAAALYLLTLHRYFGQLLVGAPTFDNLVARRMGDFPELTTEENAGREAAESERDAGAAMLRSIVTNNQAAIYVKDLDGRYLLGNPKYAEIMGRSEADFLGLTDDIAGPALAEKRRADDLTTRGGLFRMEEYNDLFSDGRRYYECVKFPLYDSDGQIYAVAGSSLDVTHERRATVEMEKSRDFAVAASAAKSTFLATMSHEIRTPMNAVIGMTDLLLDTELNEQQFEFVDTVRISGDSLLSVINDILDFSKIESGELRMEKESFHLREEVEGCLDLVVAEATAKGLDLICYVDDSCPSYVIGDAVRLRQILVNLLANAVKFTSIGEVLLSMTAEPTDDGRLRMTAVVTDTGIGISSEGVAHLFESFSQVDASTTRVYGGTGLGLAISQRLAEAMDGHVTVQSVPEMGSTFTASMVMDLSSARDVRPSGTPIVNLDGLSVLVVDDNLTYLKIVGLQLSSLGMVCAAVASPKEALKLVREGLKYDVAVVDMLMPEMNGVELATALREIPSVRDVPIVLVTSVGSRPAGAEDMFAALLAKPVKSAALLRALSAALTGGALYDSSERALRFSRMVTPLRILLAEDNVVNQRVAQLMLTKLGHHVDTVDNGVAALAAVGDADYDVVLMDVQMPEMDGLEATRRIRAEIPVARQPHIIAMTASALAEDRDACNAAGMESYLTKPVRALELKEVLGRVAATIAPAPVRTDSTPDALTLLTSPINRAVLTDLAGQLDDGTGDMVDELMSRYLVDSSEQVSQLVSAARERDAVSVVKLAHSLRSSSGVLGATRLVRLLYEAEKTARLAPQELSASARTIQVEYARVSQMLLRLRGTGQD